MNIAFNTSPTDLQTQAHAFARKMAGQAIRNGYQLTDVHVYNDATGQPIYYKIRAKHPDTGDKWIRAFHHDGTSFVAKEPTFTGGKPLYRLHELNSDAGQAVYVVEGEQKADYLAELGLIATTSGSKSSANATDWQPLTGRKVIIWPDFDDAGQAYQTDVATILSALQCDIYAIDVAQLGLPPKGDIIDFARMRAEHGKDTAAADITALPVLQLGMRKISDTPTETARPHIENGQSNALQVIEAAISQADTDIGALWENDILDAMRHVYDHNKPAWARLRLRLKQCKGLKLSDYEREIVPASDGNTAEVSTAAVLIALAEQTCTFCHDTDSEPYALIQVDAVRQCHSIKSKAYAEWLSYRFYQSEGTAPNDNALKSALATLSGKAKFEGEQVEVFTRIAATCVPRPSKKTMCLSVPKIAMLSVLKTYRTCRPIIRMHSVHWRLVQAMPPVLCTPPLMKPR